jgi:hypothetical protein
LQEEEEEEEESVAKLRRRGGHRGVREEFSDFTTAKVDNKNTDHP